MRRRSRAVAKRTCVACGNVLPVGTTAVAAERCSACSASRVDAQEVAPGGSRWLREGGGGAAAGAFAALDEVFNPSAARAREQVKADHERQVPVPSPGDDALRTGRLVIRRPAETPAQDVQSHAKE